MDKTARYSRKREAIYDLLCSTDTHPTAEWIYNCLKPGYPDLSLGTVYRNISRFKDEGLIVCVGVVGGQERFDANTGLHPHFVCDTCGAVLDLAALQDDTGIDRKAEKLYGLRVDRHYLTLHGRCPNCMTS
ncbi:MAG: transcriptional repressor [Clostridiales bacterium]|nr:transcriptional repressor [Clostridiales bacterium]